MGKILVINNADFSAVAVDKVTISDKISINVIANPVDGGIVSGSGIYE